MKTQMIVLISATAVCLTLPLRADSSASDQRDQDVAAQAGNSKSMGELRRADRVIGQDIRDDQGKKIGKVKDLAVDLQNGRIAEVIVATGGTLGMGEHLFAMPPSSFRCDAGKRELQFNGDRTKFETAPEFELSHWSDATEISRIREAYQRFGAQPYFADFSEASMANPPAADHGAQDLRENPNGLPRLGFIARATRLTGTVAMNQQNEKLGRIHDFIVDVPAGRVVEVILAHGGFLGMENDYSAVPPQAFRWNADESALTLNTTKEALRAAPHFRGSEWSYATDPDRVDHVYALYHVAPYFGGPGMDQNAQNVRERTDATSLTEKSNVADMDISEKIHKSLLANDNLSQNAKKVKIVTADGRVTLIGTVDTEDEKRLISEAATKVAGDNKVDDNQLKVRGISSHDHEGLEPVLTPPPSTDQR